MSQLTLEQNVNSLVDTRDSFRRWAKVFGLACVGFVIWVGSSIYMHGARFELVDDRIAVLQSQAITHASTLSELRDAVFEIRLLRLEIDNLRERLEESRVIQPGPRLPSSSSVMPRDDQPPED